MASFSFGGGELKRTPFLRVRICTRQRNSLPVTGWMIAQKCAEDAGLLILILQAIIRRAGSCEGEASAGSAGFYRGFNGEGAEVS